MDYNAFMPFFILMFICPRFGHSEVLQTGSFAILAGLYLSLSTSLFSSSTICSRSILYVPWSSPTIGHFSKEHYFFLGEKWHLETKIWALCVIIFRVLFFYLGRKTWSHSTDKQILFIGSIWRWVMSVCKRCWVFVSLKSKLLFGMWYHRDSCDGEELTVSSNEAGLEG